MIPVGLSPRRGPRPATTPTNPHTQLDQQPVDEAARCQLLAELSALEPVVWGESRISVPGALALSVPPDLATVGDAVFMIGTEFAHLHPDPDYSLHMVLPEQLAGAAIAEGWAEPHPVAARGLIPRTTVMVYAPRDEEEVTVVAGLVRAAHALALGIPD